MVTVNTSPIAQAAAGGRLLEHGCSLVHANERKSEVYRVGLDRIVDGLARRFPDPSGSGVSGNSPEGGFFVVVRVPFGVTGAVLERSAREHRVLWTPLHHFYGAAAAGTGTGVGPLRCLRLSCSALGPESIEEALDRFAAFVRSC
ncbi:hypothetical protein ACVV2G_23660 [Streptomyces ziwulingensis]